MKKNVILILIALGIFTSCNQDKKPTDGNSEVKPTEQTEEKKNESVANVGVLKINTQTFIEKVHDFKTEKNWKFKGERPCIIDFYADWCRPCKMLAPIMEELSTEYGEKINFYKVNVDEEGELANAFGVQSIPSVLYCPMKGNPEMKSGLFSKEEYISYIKNILIK